MNELFTIDVVDDLVIYFVGMFIVFALRMEFDVYNPYIKYFSIYQNFAFLEHQIKFF